MNQELTTLLVASSKEAMQRSRWTLMIICTISLTLMIASYNLYYSLIRFVAIRYDGLEIEKELIFGWIDSGFVTIPLLGIKTHILDGLIIFSLGLFSLTILLYYTIRRENRLIGKAFHLASASEVDKIYKFQIYYGIMSASIFGTTTEDEEPYEEGKKTKSDETISIQKWVFYQSFYLPFISIAWIFINVSLSLFVLQDPFRKDYLPFILQDMNSNELWMIIGMLAICLIMAVGCFILGFKCQKYQDVTTEQMRIFFIKNIYPSVNTINTT